MVRGASTELIKKAESGDYLALDPAFCQVGQAVRILGGGVAERRSAVIERIQVLLNEGVSPRDIRVINASPEAGFAFTKQMKEWLNNWGMGFIDQIESTTARSVAYDILSTPLAQSAVGRSFPHDKTRLLSAFELDFILEDLKTLGTRPGRLREMLKFIFRGWTELADEGEGWLVTVEEQEAFGFLNTELRFLQGVLEPELCNLATKALRKDDGIKESFVKPHIFVNDYQDLSRASQLVCHLLATSSITIAADPTCSVDVFDSYAYADGIEEFMRINPLAKSHVLNRQTSAYVSTKTWTTPEEEVAGVVALVGDKIATGNDPRKIALVCFHPHWFNQIVVALEKQNLPVRELNQPLSLKGDIRDYERSLPLRIITALRLLDDPDDSLSWRCWMGFGDYLANSAAFVETMEAAENRGQNVVFADVVRQEDRYQQSKRFFGIAEAKRGQELLEYLVQSLSIDYTTELPFILRPLLALGEEASASEMIATLAQKQSFLQFTSKEGVTVASLEMLVGQNFDEIIVLGFVDGFFPARRYFDCAKTTVNQQKQIEETDKRRLNLLLAAASRSLTLSHFEEIEFENAERLELKSSRIVLSDDKRIGRVSLSVYAGSLLD